jgi:hypothetical protein
MMVLPLVVNNTRQFPGTQPHSGYAFEHFHVTDAGFRERRQFDVDLRARCGGEFAPLADGGGSERDLFHGVTIA